MDSNLLKEAIADAKAVRQTALANAKVALEEAFSEKYHAMFAEKLKEDAAAVDQVPPVAEGDGMKSTEENVSEQEIDELIKELENEVGGEQPHPEPDEDDIGTTGEESPIPPVGGPAVPGAVPPTGVPGEVGTAGAPPVAPPGYILVPTSALITPEGGAGIPGIPGSPDASLGAPPAGEMGAEIPPSHSEVPGQTPPPSDVPPVAGEEEDEDVNLDELLESLKEEVGEEEEEEESKKIDEDKKLASSGIGGNKAGGSDNKKPSSSASSTSAIESGGLKQEGVPSPGGEGTKIGPEDATKAPRPNQGKNATSTNLSTPSKGGESGNALKASRPNQGKNATSTNLSTPGGMLEEENNNLKKQLNEAEDTIKYVKGQLNEINLLNAKLLYTNKLFKEYNMNNDQKMRIVEMFDLSKNVREVKLTYANIAESLNFSGSDIKRKVVQTSNTNVHSITEGLASKPVGSTKPTKEIISESKSAMVSKFQKLAGIKKK